MSSQIAPHLWLPELKLSFHPDRASDRELHPLRGLLRFGPYSKGLIPDPIRVATIAPHGEGHLGGHPKPAISRHRKTGH